MMPNLIPEIKSTRSQIAFRQIGSFVLVFIPLAAGVAGWAVWGLDVPPQTALGGLVLFGTAGLCATALAAARSARSIASRFESVEDVVAQMSAGEFDKRIPPGDRQQIEDLAASLDRTQSYLKSRVTDLESSRNQLRTVLDSMVEGVIALDSDQRVLLVNEAGRRLFPLQELSAVGRPVWELVRSPQLAQWVSQALLQSEPVGGELELKAPVARILSVRVAGLPASSVAGSSTPATSSPGFNSPGSNSSGSNSSGSNSSGPNSAVSPSPGLSSAGAVIVASDISQLRRLEHVRQEFVANASHELKTPLASIKACVETLLDGALEDVEIRVKFLEMVNEQTERLDKLVRDLLALTRIESQERSPQLHPVDLAGIIDLCVNRHRQYAERKEMRLITVPASEAVLVMADEEALEQILDNLIDNAIKYTNSGGTITVRWINQGNRCRLEVEDTGIGIPQAHIQRIFERFYRVDRARSRELGGTGLGLSIVKHLVQILEGTVAVTSRLGKGTTFIVELNCA